MNLQPQYRVILRYTLKRCTTKLYELEHYELVEMFTSCNGRISVTRATTTTAAATTTTTTTTIIIIIIKVLMHQTS